MSDNEIKVEFFGKVRPHQSNAFNFHLQEQLKAFDQEYAKSGVIGSQNHASDRQKFARLASQSILDSFEHDSGYPAEMKTETTLASPSLGKSIRVRTVSTFGTSDPRFFPPWG